MSRYANFQVESTLTQWEIECRKRRMVYWEKLRKARADYFNETVEHKHPDLGGFRYWMERRWGVAIEIIDGNVGSEYVVKDEHKFLLFQMKYT